ncbi:unnamed protein product, partial [Laminaria digitata]
SATAVSAAATAATAAADGTVLVAAASSLPRIDVTGLSPSQVAVSVDFSQPCILTGVLPSAACEEWCDSFMDDLGEEEVDFQVRDNRDGLSEVFRSSLTDFIYGLQDESTHDKSWYLLEEHLLELPQARPQLGALLATAQELLGPDEFQLFPSSVRPQNLCAIVGGVGARSFLHSDPMEWMGWNVLLEGRKLWTFLPPSPELDVPLGTYRLAPNAFGSHNISAGWQSNVDLYQRAGEVGVDARACALWPSEGGEGGEVMRQAVSGVQEQGELVLIPPRCWHQVYHLEPSVAVASQYMDHRVRHRVFRHILDWCGAAEEARPFPAQLDLLTHADQIREVLKAALVARLGPEEGQRCFDNLD